jgi:hypothetical protein
VFLLGWHAGLASCSPPMHARVPAVQFIPRILFPSIPCQVFWPLESVPGCSARSRTCALDVRRDGVRSVMCGWPAEIWPDLAVRLLFRMAMLALSVVLLRRRGARRSTITKNNILSFLIIQIWPPYKVNYKI